MRSILLGLTVLLLAFLVGADIVFVWSYSNRPEITDEDVAPPERLPFVGFMGNDSAEDYLVSPTLQIKSYPSAVDANRAFEEELRALPVGVRIINRGAKLNPRGKVVGRRVSTWFCCGQEGQSVAHIYWTDREKFYDVNAATMERALAFEREAPW